MPADTIYIPVIVDSLDGRDVLSADFTVSFADTVLNSLGVSVAGTIAETADTAIANITVPGKISVSIANPTPLAGSGTLINLSFKDFIFRSAAVDAGDFSTTSITLTSLAADSTGNDFMGVAYGDVTGSWTQNPGITRPVSGMSRVVGLGSLGGGGRLPVLVDDAAGIYSGYLELAIDSQSWQVMGVECGDLT